MNEDDKIRLRYVWARRKFLVTRRIPLLTDTDWAKSTAAKVKPHIAFDDYELCDDCLLKVTNVMVHFRGDTPKIIHEYDKGEA